MSRVLLSSEHHLTSLSILVLSEIEEKIPECNYEEELENAKIPWHLHLLLNGLVKMDVTDKECQAEHSLDKILLKFPFLAASLVRCGTVAKLAKRISDHEEKGQYGVCRAVSFLIIILKHLEKDSFELASSVREVSQVKDHIINFGNNEWPAKVEELLSLLTTLK